MWRLGEAYREAKDWWRSDGPFATLCGRSRTDCLFIDGLLIGGVLTAGVSYVLKPLVSWWIRG